MHDPRLRPLIDKHFPCHQHVAELLEEMPARLGRRHVREGDAEGGQHPGIDPVGLGELSAGFGKIPGLGGG